MGKLGSQPAGRRVDWMEGIAQVGEATGIEGAHSILYQLALRPLKIPPS